VGRGYVGGGSVGRGYVGGGSVGRGYVVGGWIGRSRILLRPQLFSAEADGVRNAVDAGAIARKRR
jgi:hypothetical protein